VTPAERPDPLIEGLKPCRVCGENVTPGGRTCTRCQMNLDDEETRP
jgi:predicted nucleic acid-binding Zn ribbon protein